MHQSNTLVNNLHLAEEYHILSRNQKGYKFIKNQHLVHYRDDIVQLKTRKTVDTKGEALALPTVEMPEHISLQQALLERKSGRDFQNRPITLSQLSTLLYFANGYHQSGGSYRKFVPSSGGLNSVEVFAIVLNSHELSRGIYHYQAETHELRSVNQGDFRDYLYHHVFYQEEYARASVVMAITSAYGKLAHKYGQRSYRLSLLDVGHVSQNLYLVATALGMPVCASAGFIDDELDEALQIDGLELATFLTVMIG